MKSKTAVYILSVCIFIGMSVWGHGLHAAGAAVNVKVNVKVTHKPASITKLDAAWAWAVISFERPPILYPSRELMS